MRIGIERDFYPEKRCIIDKVDGVEYKDVSLNNPFLILKKIQYRLSLSWFRFRPFRYYSLIKPRVDVIHFFNTISFSSTPWISHFETLVPRYDELFTYHHGEDREIPNRRKAAKALKQMARDSCKRIVSISECSRNIQLDFLKQFPEYYERIAHKVDVLHPPQPLLIGNIEEKDFSGDKVKFVFLGAAFHRKGGVEVYNVFDKLRQKYDFELTIISRVEKKNYATKETDEDVRIMKKKIEDSDWLTYYEYLPNQEALDVLKQNHIGLLLTWADSYGYSLLECQAAGCAVISTNVRAMTEINNNEVGWVVEIPKNDLGEALYDTEEQRRRIRETMEEQLEQILIDIFKNPGQVKKKAGLSLERIRADHSPVKYGEKLLQIYKESVS